MRLSSDLRRIDDLAAGDTPLHRLDARAKALTTLLFAGVVISFPPREVGALVPLLSYPVALAAVGRVPAAFLLRRLLAALPFAVFLGIGNLAFDREPVAVSGSATVAGGWLSSGSILLRVALTVAAALALVATTGVHRLTAALARLGVPRGLAAQVQVLSRYLFVVADEAGRMTRAAALRAPGRGVGLRTWGALVGTLLLRSLDRGERVHRSMLARGYDGRMPPPPARRWRAADTAFLVGWTAFFAAARAWDLPAALGAFLLARSG